MTRKKPAPAQGISLASSEAVLFHTGGPVYGDAPARDLTAADLAYIWRVASLRASGGLPVGTATPADLEATATELSATGAFSREAVAVIGEEGPELHVATDAGFVVSAEQTRALAESEGPEAPADPAEEIA